jgi:hypothetical protein
LFGGATPFVLHPTASGQYLFLMECYVHGLPGGEAMEKWQKGEIKIKYIQLSLTPAGKTCF